MDKFACGQIAGKTLEYSVDDNCSINMTECDARGWTCFPTQTTKDGKSVKICCTWK
jgi:hypothetical protein